ncbi:MAG: redox-regulated ATPase YchF, partial [Candidatus Marinimicrobia bacterium]|nr:redox-regulated ATPase YchF [Candidatus Neomarinimicrobiota bacterium]
MQLGFIGLKFSGKSTLFELLTNNHFETANTGTGEVRRGQVLVADDRIKILSDLYNPKKTTYTKFDCVDIMGITSSGKDNLSGKYLESVRQVDGLVAVIQMFDGFNSDGSKFEINPVNNIKMIEEELIFADLMVLENRLEKVEKLKQRGAPQFNKKELEVLLKCKQILDEEKSLRTVEFTIDEKKLISGFQYLSRKPLIIVLNFDDSNYPKREQYEQDIIKLFPNRAITSVSALEEKEIQELDAEEQKEFMAEMGIDEPAIKQVIETAYKGLGLISFFTVGEDEVRAWTIKKDTIAKEASGTIHSDLEKGFIRAEIINYTEFMKYKSLTKAKESGSVRVEGKSYIVKDGDILNV